MEKQVNDPGATPPAPLTPEGPAFARSFPPHPALGAAVDAFARGNFAEVRRLVASLVDAEDPALRAAARELLSRTRPDPLAAVLVALTAALLVTLSVYWVVHQHEHPPPRPLRPATPAAP